MSSKYQPTVCVVGGGAAGFFGAITAAQRMPDAKVIILEQNKTVLNKVRIAGGGRCNVTHACFDPKELVQFYPRGQKELLGPFYTFNPSHIFDWFESRGVSLKTESDNRVFPVSDESSDIVNCLIQEAKKHKVQIWSRTKILSVEQEKSTKWVLRTASGQAIIADAVLIATGSAPLIWEMLSEFHEITEPVPSLFTFNIQHAILKGLQGISMPNVKIRLAGHALETEGALLITHWGLSGPAVLKMSAWGARVFHSMQYRFSIVVNWTGIPKSTLEQNLLHLRNSSSKRKIYNTPLFEISSRLWKSLLRYIKISEERIWPQLNDKQLFQLAQILCECGFKVNGKSTFKEEFVTAGGIALNEVDFRTMESRKKKNLFFAGEVLDIDALTGGFNFQAAWTTGFIAGESIAEILSNRK